MMGIKVQQIRNPQNTRIALRIVPILIDHHVTCRDRRVPLGCDMNLGANMRISHHLQWEIRHGIIRMCEPIVATEVLIRDVLR